MHEQDACVVAQHTHSLLCFVSAAPADPTALGMKGEQGGPQILPQTPASYTLAPQPPQWENFTVEVSLVDLMRRPARMQRSLQYPASNGMPPMAE